MLAAGVKEEKVTIYLEAIFQHPLPVIKGKETSGIILKGSTFFVYPSTSFFLCLSASSFHPSYSCLQSQVDCYYTKERQALKVSHDVTTMDRRTEGQAEQSEC